MKNEKAIIPRITNLKLVAKEPKKKKHQVTGSYIVARSVYRDPEHLPSSMQYYLLDHQYAYIRCKTKRINEAYEILESWIIDKGYQHNKNTFTIELHRALPNPNAEEEVEIYLPIKDIPLP